MAIKLYNGEVINRIMISGGYRKETNYKLGRIYMRYLLKRGVKKEHIILEEASVSINENIGKSSDRLAAKESGDTRITVIFIIACSLLMNRIRDAKKHNYWPWLTFEVFTERDPNVCPIHEEFIKRLLGWLDPQEVAWFLKTHR
jgi:hypothetical protein